MKLLTDDEFLGGGAPAAPAAPTAQPAAPTLLSDDQFLGAPAPLSGQEAKLRDKMTASWGEVLTGLPGAIKGTLQESVGGIAQRIGERLSPTGDNASPLAAAAALVNTLVAGPKKAAQDVNALNTLAKTGAGIAESGRINDEAATPTLPMTTGQRVVRGVATSGAAMLPSMLVGSVAGPGAGLATIGGLTAGQGYQEARSKGLSSADAATYSDIQGGIEAGTEALPFSALLKEGSTLGRRALEYFVSEVPGEQIATFGQGVTDALYGLREDAKGAKKSVLQYIQEDLPQEELDTLLVTLALGGATVPAGHLLSKVGTAPAPRPPPAGQPPPAAAGAPPPDQTPPAAAAPPGVPPITPAAAAAPQPAAPGETLEGTTTPLTDEEFLGPQAAATAAQEAPQQAQPAGAPEATAPAASAAPAPAAAPEAPIDEEALARAAARAQAQRERYAAEAKVNPQADDILAAIAKLGGLSRDQAKAEGFDPAEFGRRGWKIKRVFTKDGMGFDQMAEALAQHGYPVTEADGAYSKNAILNAVDNAIRGQRVLSLHGQAEAADAAIAQREADQQAAADAQAQDDPFGPGGALEDEDTSGLHGGSDVDLSAAAARAAEAGVPEAEIEAILERGAIRDEPPAETIARLEGASRGRAPSGAPVVQGPPEAPRAGSVEAEQPPVLAPYTPQDLTDRQAQIDAAPAAEQKAQIDREREGFTLQPQTAPQAAPVTIDLLGGPTPADLNRPRPTPPPATGRGGLFEQPSQSGTVAGPAEPPAAPAVTPNKVFTDEAAEKARARLRAKLGRLNTGLDPETLIDGITIAGNHIEKGARTFAAYAKAMIDDLGEGIRPYLRSLYEAIRTWPGMEAIAREMTPADQIEADTPAAAPEGPEAQRAKLTDLYAEHFTQGKAIEGIAQARQMARTVVGTHVLPGTPLAKVVDEAVEAGAVRAARALLAGIPETDAAARYDAMVALYERMPNLNVRTSTSVLQQAYSTPLPIALAASRLAGVRLAGTTYEPSAGNGALLIEAAPGSAIANELNPARAQALQAQGFRVRTEDATQFAPPARSVDVVIANPPFGVVKDANGQSIRYQVSEGYATNEIDHAISLRALEAMKPDGRAVLIVGGVNETVQDPEKRADAYNGLAKRAFYYNLYQGYNVVDHFTVSGELYAKQGAAWPVDIIVIDGVGKSSLPLPAAAVPRMYTSFDALKEVLREEPDRLGAREQPDRGRGVGAEGRDREPGRVPEPARGTPAVDAGQGAGPADVPVVPGERPAVGGLAGRRPAGPAGRGRVPGGGRAVPGPAVDAGRPGPAAGTDQGIGTNRGTPAADDLGGMVDGVHGTPPGGQRSVAPAREVETSTQVAYTPSSRGAGMGTLVPVNMRSSIADALDALRQRVGSVDQYVAERLGLTPAEANEYFAAEQIDALALGISNMEAGAGFIIGDQTGIGKGRVVAGMIRYALQHGRVPIFVTEKVNLYSDMYRDLSDIGLPDIRILPTNNSLKIALDDEQTKFLETRPGHAGVLREAMERGSLGDYDVIFTTYSQLQTINDRPTERMAFIGQFANGGILIFDESHNAGGQEASERDKNKNQGPRGRAGFARAIIQSAYGVFYSSATYAKRPEVMDLYAKTDMRLAVSDISQLAEAIRAGGVPLQQAVASMLAKAGQYIRRERSFDGIVYETRTAPTDRNTAERVSAAMRAVAYFDIHKKAAVKEISKALRAEAKKVSDDGSTGGAGASSTNFTSIMHNLIDQMLLILKLDASIEAGLEALKAGRKPVFALANTMGSFIEDFAQEYSLNPGDAIDVTFGDLLRRYLERSRDVLIKDHTGESRRQRLTDEQLGPLGVQAYQAALDTIDEHDWSKMPISPIDWIRSRLIQAGYKVGEITGRSQVVDYTQGRPIYRVRPSSEVSPNGRRATISKFNSGEIDAVILNQSGATGLSLHASDKFRDQRQRHMLIVQAEKNIDTHMQMLGRIHRTGQVVKPMFSQMIADIPAEKRPAAVLAKKMASLNANTTAARDSALTAKDVVDFMNEYGDTVVAAIMDDNRNLHRHLGSPLAEGDNGLDPLGATRKVTGRIPLLPIKQQEELYELIESEYQEFVAQKEAVGENILEAKNLDLDARPAKEPVVVSEGEPGNSSPFAGPAQAETLNVKRLGQAYKPDQVLTMVREALGEKSGTLAELSDVGRQRMDHVRSDSLSEFTAYKKNEIDALESDRAKQSRGNALDAMRARFEELTDLLHIGATVNVTIGGVPIPAVVTNLERKGSTDNPVAPGAWKVTFALADAARSLRLGMSRLTIRDGGDMGGLVYVGRSWDDPDAILSLFERATAATREDRVIVTGNLLAAYGTFKQGQIVNYTTHDGAVRQGVLMPKSFDIEREMDAAPIVFKNAQEAINALHDVPNAIVYATPIPLQITRTRSGDYLLKAPASKAAGGAAYLNKTILDTAGQDFVKAGGTMRMTVTEDTGARVLRALEADGIGFKATTHKDEIRKAIGRAPEGPKFARAGGARDRYRMHRLETAGGPAFEGADVSLWPAGHDLDGRLRFVVIDSATSMRVGDLTMTVDGSNFREIHWIGSDVKGFGRRMMRALVATTDGPVKVSYISPNARGFYEAVGAYGYTENGKFAAVDWQHYRATDKGLVADDTGRAARGAQRRADPGLVPEPRQETRPGQGRDLNAAPERGLSISEAREYLAARFGARALENLERAGVVKLITSDQAPGEARDYLAAGEDVYGYYDNGVSHLIVDHLTRDGGPTDAYGILLHEVGVHHGMRAMLGDKLFSEVVTQTAAAVKRGPKDAFARAVAQARTLVPAGTPARDVNEETVAWLVTERANHDLPLIRRILAKLRAFLVARGFTKALNADALVELARGAAEKAGGRAGRDGAFAMRPGTFYSQALKATRDMPMPKATPDQWRAYWKKAGVKDDELKWIGVDEFMAGRATVSRDDMAAFVGAHGVGVEEVMLGGPQTPNKSREDAILEAEDAVVQQAKDEGMGNDAAEYFAQRAPDFTDAELRDLSADMRRLVRALQDAHTDDLWGRTSTLPKYGRHTLPGGENYRELLLTLPTKSADLLAEANRLHRLVGVAGTPGSERMRLLAERDRLRAEAEQAQQFKSPHFDQPNILAHVRFNDRTSTAGGFQVVDTDSGNKSEMFPTAEAAKAYQAKLPEKVRERTKITVSNWAQRVLFIEEIQSDWAQEGRKHGFKADAAEMDALKAEHDAATKAVQEAAGTANYDAALQRLVDVTDTYNRRINDADVPLAPFVGKTDAWVGLALKRMIRYAAENGYDRIAWTTGEQQAARYDLSKQLSRIEFDDNATTGSGLAEMDGPPGSGTLRAYDHDGKEVIKKYVRDPNKLSEYIGKEAAEKLLNQPANQRHSFGSNVRRRELRGLDLKVGGEGMRTFYDQIVPKVARDLLKKLGGGTVGPVMKAVAMQGTAPQMGFDITPELRASAMRGLPLFARGRRNRAPELESALRKANLLDDERSLVQRARDWAADTWAAVKADAKDRMQEGVFDQFHGIKTTEQHVAGNLPAEQSGYVAARLSTGLSSAMYGILRYGAPQWRDGVLSRKDGTKGLLDILDPVKDDLQGFFGWMIGRRAQRLMGQGKENLFTADEIAALVGLHRPEYDAVSREFAEFKRAVLDVAEEAGLIDAETRPSWDLADWIPFYRIHDEQTQGPRGRRGLSHQTSGIRQLRGGKSFLGDPLENIAMNFAHLIDASLKNHAIRLTVRNVLPAGNSVLEEIPRAEFTRAIVPVSQVNDLLRGRMVAQGMTETEAKLALSAIPKAAMEGFAKMWAVRPPSDPDVIRVMDKGKTSYYRVNDPALLRGLTAVNQEAFGGIVRLMRGFKRILTGAVTADPTFMARNFLRDAMHAWVITPHQFKFGVDSIRGAIRSFRETGGAVDMYFSGASFMGGYANANDPAALAGAIRDALRVKGYDASATNKYLATLIDSPAKLWEMWRHVGDNIENASREAVFEAALRDTGSRAQAVFEAKDMMDYSMRGNFALIRLFGDVLPFFNARLQGLNKLARAGAVPGLGVRKAVIARASLIVLASLALWWLNHDRDEYKELEDWDKDANWHFWIFGQHYRIPKPFELGLLYGTVPERMAARMAGQDDNAKSFQRFLWALSSTMAFDPAPQIVNPAMAVYANRDPFTGRPIENESDQGKTPGSRYNESTSETMRLLGQYIGDQTGLSPKRLEYLWGGYLGTLGMYALGVSDLAVRAASDMPELPERRLDQLPVLKAFVRESPAFSTQYQTDVYDMFEEADQLYRTVRAKVKEDRADEAGAIVAENADKLRARPMLQKSVDTLAGLRKQMDEVYRDRKMTPKEKRARLDELMQARNDLARRTAVAAKPAF